MTDHFINEGAEKAVIGTMLAGSLQDTDAWFLLRDEHFSSVLFREIFNDIRELEMNGNTEYLPILVGKAKEGERVYRADHLGEIMTAGLYTVDGFSSSVQDILVKWKHRERYMALKAASEKYLKEPDLALSEFDAVLERTETHNLEYHSMGDILKEHLFTGVPLAGIPCGISGLDEFFHGYLPGQLHIIAGRPGSAKTSLAGQLSLNIAMSGVPNLFITLEMSRDEMIVRMASHLSGMNSELIRLKDPSLMASETFTGVYERMSELPIYFDDNPSRSVADIYGSLKRLKKEKHIRVGFIDYLSLISVTNPKESRAEQIAKITRSLKLIARKLHLSIVLLSQLNRQGSERPMLHHLKDSGSIEQDADTVLMIHRLNDQTPIRELIIAKNRNGAVGSLFCDFRGEIFTFDGFRSDPEAY